MWAILARLIPPTSLARLVLPAVLARTVTPPLARASVVAPIGALGASTDTPFSHSPELLAFVCVVGVEVVVGAEWSSALGRLRLVPVVLCVWFFHEHDHSLALHILGLGLLVWVSRWELEEG